MTSYCQLVELFFVTLHARNGETFSAFSSACFYHSAPVGCRHALTETMLVSSFSLRGLICAFLCHCIFWIKGRKDRNVFKPKPFSDTFVIHMATIKKEDLPKAKLNKESLKRATRIFKFIGPHKWKFVIGMIFLVGTGSTGLIFPKLLGNMMGLIGRADTSNEQLLAIANKVGIQLLILFAFQAFFSFFRVVLFVNVTENMLAALRQATFNRLTRMPMSFFSTRQVSELNSRVSADISQIQDTFTTSIAEFIGQSMIIVGGIAIICFTSWRLALMMLAIIPVLALLAVFFGRKIRKISKGVQDSVADSNIIVGETLQGIANVKSFTNEKHEN